VATPEERGLQRHVSFGWPIRRLKQLGTTCMHAQGNVLSTPPRGFYHKSKWGKIFDICVVRVHGPSAHGTVQLTTHAL